MKIMEGVNTLKGRPAEIPACGRDDLPAFFVEMGYTCGVEIGVDRGVYSEQLLKAGLKVYGVDPWLAYSGYDVANYPFQKKLDNFRDIALKRLSPYIESGQSVLIRKTSMEAVGDFADQSLDFVYIDGHHGFRYVAEDLVEWYEKVRPGGAISGHDYYISRRDPRHPYAMHVRYVLDAFTRAYGIRNWYVLGRRFPPAGEHRDKYRSFMWIKD